MLSYTTIARQLCGIVKFPGKYVTSDAEILVMGMLHNLHLPHLFQDK